MGANGLAIMLLCQKDKSEGPNNGHLSRLIVGLAQNQNATVNQLTKNASVKAKFVTDTIYNVLDNNNYKRMLLIC